MAVVDVINKKAEKVSQAELKDEIYSVPVKPSVMHEVVTMQLACRRAGTAAVKHRSDIRGSGKKLFRQKGTGNARVGNIRTGKRRGGGMIFAKSLRDFRKRMPKKQKRLARDSAILAKLLNDNVVVVDGLEFDKPKTKELMSVLTNLKIDRSCLVTLDSVDENILKSARNIPKVLVLPVSDLNAFEICSYRKMLFTKDALLSVLGEGETN